LVSQEVATLDANYLHGVTAELLHLAAQQGSWMCSQVRE
jgi:hypothetical protein